MITIIIIIIIIFIASIILTNHINNSNNSIIHNSITMHTDISGANHTSRREGGDRAMALRESGSHEPILRPPRQAQNDSAAA